MTQFMAMGCGGDVREKLDAWRKQVDAELDQLLADTDDQKRGKQA
jgi:hypothetical protein